MEFARAIELAAVAVAAYAGLASWVTAIRVERKLNDLERVGVLMTSDREAGRMARPMSPRERVRWIERRINGAQRATP